jgi:hypothetical protein
MAIYDFPSAEKEASPDLGLQKCQEKEGEQLTATARGQIFSAVAARLFFLLLLLADLIWIGYSLVVFLISATGTAASRGKIPFFKNLYEKTWVSLRRSIVCGVSLLVALFSPAFGVMIACTYFLMYDKAGIEEVVPSALQAQFKEFLPQGGKEQNL